jgi:hypothetical protein
MGFDHNGGRKRSTRPAHSLPKAAAVSDSAFAAA